jgi:hypothetical protein
MHLPTRPREKPNETSPTRFRPSREEQNPHTNGSSSGRAKGKQSSERPEMLYNVRATPKTTHLQRFWTMLNDGTIGGQEPDGREIIASMKRAVLTGSKVEWSETCYCTPPLNHERTTIYDQFFSEIEVQPQNGPTSSPGEQFWQYLQRKFDGTPKIGNGGGPSAGLRHIPLRLL